MEYENAVDVLPADLLEQVQKFAAGKLLYVPKAMEKLPWSETTGYKQYLTERNNKIKEMFSRGYSVEQLADEYNLSMDSIKKIAYSKQNEQLKYRCSASSARQFANAGRLEEWVHQFLLSDGHNKAFSDGLKLFDRFFLGLLTMPLALFSRCSGPEKEMKYQENKEWFEKRVLSLKKAFESNTDIPPLIVHYVGHDFELNDGNHRLEALNRLSIKEYPVIVWITEQVEYDEFVERFSGIIK